MGGKLATQWRGKAGIKVVCVVCVNASSLSANIHITSIANSYTFHILPCGTFWAFSLSWTATEAVTLQLPFE